MRGWQHTTRGLPSQVLTLSDSLALPTLTSPTQALIKVHHAALNPAGSIFMQLCPGILRRKPCIPEMDFSGEIVSVGAAVPLTRGFEPGVQVFGSVSVAEHLRGQGSLCEFLVVDSDGVELKPGNVSMVEAAGLGIAGCTALAVLDAAVAKGLAKGMRVLINGAAGGIGCFVTEMVRDRVGKGGYIVAISSGDKVDLLRELGADEVLDRKSVPSVSSHLTENHAEQPFEMIIDAYGVQELYNNSAAFLKPDGHFVTVGIAFTEYSYGSMAVAVRDMLWNVVCSAWGGSGSRRYVQVASACNLDSLERLRVLCEDRALRVPIDSQWAFEDALKAYERMVSRSAKGKIVVNVLKDVLVAEGRD
ncbi:hypothetical protein LTR84_008148 [Exophiala bonariae]|uniref:Enoyl reductase (ER) domain-containing protein n=1 Tax=Exophiala bonariae TaxID=1690606 RepID=A0AAV9NPT3_9EURO|nr:hypothetical protein LTR84_008148 [Exophiala bonariae]